MERDYKLSKDAYHETIWFIRQYRAYKQEYRSLIDLRGMKYEMKIRSGLSDPTFEAVRRTERVKGKIDAIERGFSQIPEEYRKGIFENIITKKPYPDFADTSTWKRWKRRVVWYVYIEKEGI